MADWKSNLNQLLNMHGNYPFQKWNDQLYSLCRSWADFVNDRSGISASVSTTYPLEVVLTVKHNERPLSSFICHLSYKAEERCEPSLFIKSVNSFDYAGYVHALPDGDIKLFYVWDEDEISGEEIFQQGFIAELITIAFKKYLAATAYANH